MKNINWLDHILNFIAVILGVSLAFYFSSSHESRKATEELEGYTKSFISELKDDLDTYENYQIPYNEEQVDEINTFLLSINSIEEDSLAKYLDVILNLNAYNPVGGTFESMRSSGKLSLIPSLDLKIALGTYYMELGEESKLIGLEQTNYFMNTLIPHIAENYDMTGDISDEDLRGDLRLINYLALYGSLINNKTEKYYGLVDAAKDLIKELEELE